MRRSQLSFSICIPIYKGSHVLGEALQSITKQGFKNYEIIIGDDNPPTLKKEIRKTRKIIKSLRNVKVRYLKNRKNLGYPKNLQKIVSHAKNDVIFLMAQDDILAKDALKKTHDAFFLAKDIGAVTRPYFWFEDNISKPIRAVEPINPNKDTVLSLMKDGQRAVTAIFGSVGQLSGLAYRRKFIDVPFHDDVFPAHIYPFAGIVKKYKCVFLKDYTVAVGVKESQTRHVSSIYDKSPLETWIKMFNTVYAGRKYERIRKLCIKHIVLNYEGFVQIKNYARPGLLYKEIAINIKYYWPSIFHIKFWFYVLLTVLTPPAILIPLTDFYKRYYAAKRLDIHFEL